MPWCSHTHTPRRKRDLFNRLMSTAVGARRGPAQTVGLRIRLLVSWPSHTAASFPNARLSIRTGEQWSQAGNMAFLHTSLAYVSCIRMGWRKDSIVCPALSSDSRRCMSLNHLLVSCCSVVVDYEGIIQCACFPRSTIATQAASFCLSPVRALRSACGPLRILPTIQSLNRSSPLVQPRPTSRRHQYQVRNLTPN